jgi:hypothetical protein
MGKLVDRLRAEIADEHQSQIKELISNDLDGNQPTQRGFSAAVTESNAAALEDLEAEAVRYLRSGVDLKVPSVHQAFLNRFGGPSGLGFSKLGELIRKYSSR